MRHIEYPYSHDEEFLKQMDELNLQEQYVKMTLLDWYENPIEDIQGIVTGGSLNLDGKSSQRRTCNLQVFVKDNDTANVTKLDNMFSLNKKMYLEIGLKNMTQKYVEYPIIWYPQGVFVMIQPALSNSTGGTSIQLNLKDKMCLLNGECGGIIPAAVQFDKEDTKDENGNWVVDRPLIIQIIRNLVNHFGGEDLSKIFINDLDTRIKQVMRWKGEQPLYVKNVKTQEDEAREFTTEIPTSEKYDVFYKDDDVGYIYTDFTYPHDQELVANAGDSVTSILDKIKEVLGNSYEYFYDIDGNFIWREIKNYLNTTRATVTLLNLKDENYIVEPYMDKKVYDFTDTTLISAYSNTPQYNMIKNDYVVWGIKKSLAGQDLPIRYHLAIDDKPKIKFYLDKDWNILPQGQVSDIPCWGFYQVAFYDDKITQTGSPVRRAIKPIVFSNESDMRSHKGFARNFYTFVDSDDIYKWRDGEYVLAEEEHMTKLKTVPALDWRTALYFQGLEGEPLSIDRPYYDQELYNEWPKIYDVENGKWYDETLRNENSIEFFLDLIDSAARISEFKVANIGRRSKVITDNKVNCIFEPQIKDYIILDMNDPDIKTKRRECEIRGQKFTQAPNSIYKLLSIGGKWNSAYKVVRDLLYQQTSYNEAISLQSVPIFHLEPNTRIGVNDAESNIYGDYLISTISIPLAASGTMTISATKAIERI